MPDKNLSPTDVFTHFDLRDALHLLIPESLFAVREYLFAPCERLSAVRGYVFAVREQRFIQAENKFTAYKKRFYTMNIRNFSYRYNTAIYAHSHRSPNIPPSYAVFRNSCIY